MISFLFRDELKLGHSRKPVYKAYVSVCMGDAESLRHKHPGEGLSVEQQIACLIDQATDPNILGRTWVGWEPWM
jgi:DNA-dependent protein kinase catalytic subunit